MRRRKEVEVDNGGVAVFAGAAGTPPLVKGDSPMSNSNSNSN